MDSVELDVTGIAHGGFGVARGADGRVVFVADAIPGERVRAVLTESKKSFARAVAVEVLEASPDRVDHVWPEASIERAPERRVGGAEFGHIRLARQRALKAEVLRDALQRFGGVAPERIAALEAVAPGEPVQAAPGDEAANGLGWRTRVRLHVAPDGRPGQFAPRSHRVVPVASLPLADPGTAPVLRQIFAAGDTIDAITTGGELRLVFSTTKGPAQKPTVITERAGERTFRVDDTGFWQVHREAPGVLVRAVREAIDGDLLDPSAANLDLYGGVGLLASAIADVGGAGTRVETIESDERASRHAAENLGDLPDAVATTARVDRWARSAAPAPGATIVLDPPRSGAGIETAAAIAGLGAAQLVYVACDPVALARDTRTLEEHGYELTRLRAHDLFPHTHHLEAVATFIRR
ncbi:MAG: class I SAM-dependent RNA methyltransferase [Microbacteriaceae bacterium]|nr:class I SAM-dependent RNA methyltransferase [Microbacteriaceae bacterium]